MNTDKNIKNNKRNLKYLIGVQYICLAERKLEDVSELNDKIDFEIATLLQSQYYSLDQLVKNLDSGTGVQKIERIRELLDAGKIKTDGKNYYL